MNHTPTRWPRPHADPAAGALAELAAAITTTDLLGDDWPEQAACRGDGTDRHWPVGEEDSEGYQRQAGEALDVCAWCPVRAECLRYALSAGEDEGIWGGTTPAERRRLRESDRTATRSHIAS